VVYWGDYSFGGRQEGNRKMLTRHLITLVGFVAILLPSRTFARHFHPSRLDDQNTAAKDDIFLSSSDDSYDNDAHQEKFSYKYKNIGSKTINVGITVKAQHHGYYQSKPPPAPFRAETFRFTLAAGEEHEVSGTWTIDKPAGEGDPEMQYGDDDNPELIQAAYSDK
jgi:hypothetical protein